MYGHLLIDEEVLLVFVPGGGRRFHVLQGPDNGGDDAKERRDITVDTPASSGDGPRPSGSGVGSGSRSRVGRSALATAVAEIAHTTTDHCQCLKHPYYAAAFVRAFLQAEPTGEDGRELLEELENVIKVVLMRFRSRTLEGTFHVAYLLRGCGASTPHFGTRVVV